MKVYAFSGLGADGRIFKYLSLSHEIIPVQWIEPLQEESLESYALRLGEQIDESQPFALLGVSFGGMLVSELSKTMKPEKVILISSAATRYELPFMSTVSRLFRLHKILPARIYKPPTFVAYFGFPASKKQREVAIGIIQDTDYHFVKWALGAIVNWSNEQTPSKMLHIHGKLDPILPLKKRMNAMVLGSGHFIILRKSNEISSIIEEHIAVMA